MKLPLSVRRLLCDRKANRNFEGYTGALEDLSAAGKKYTARTDVENGGELQNLISLLIRSADKHGYGKRQAWPAAAFPNLSAAYDDGLGSRGSPHWSPRAAIEFD